MDDIKKMMVVILIAHLITVQSSSFASDPKPTVVEEAAKTSASTASEAACHIRTPAYEVSHAVIEAGEKYGGHRTNWREESIKLDKILKQLASSK